MAQLEQEGDFRGDIIDYGMWEPEGKQSLAVTLKVAIREMWYDGAWCDYSEHGLEVEGNVWIIGADGELKEKAVQRLVNNAGWDGVLATIQGKTWEPTPVAVTVQREEYDGTVRYRIAFVNPYGNEPRGGGMKVLDESKVKSLESRFGAKLRAIVGNAKRTTPPPAGSKPAAPKKPTKEPVAAAANGDGGDGIPFAWVGILVALGTGAMPWIA